MSTPDTNALIERLCEMELYEFDVPATMNIGSEGYYRTEIGELAAEALRTLSDENEKVLGLLGEAKCPNCDGTGQVETLLQLGEWEIGPCEWCYERDQLIPPSIRAGQLDDGSDEAHFS